MTIIQQAHPVDSLGHEVIGLAPPEGSIATFVSPDYTKKYTWWYAATDVTGQTLTLDSGTTYNFPHQHIICKPMITDDHAIELGDLNRDFKIYDDGVEIDYGSISALNYDDGIVTYTGGDITSIDFTQGKVTFAEAPTGPVTADYSYSDGEGTGSSVWEIVPEEDKIVRMKVVELQMTPDVMLPPGSRAYFNVMVNTTQYGWLVGATNQYKSFRDKVARSNKGYEVLANDEFTADRIIVLPWDYPAVIDLKYDLGPGYETPSMKLNFYLTDDKPYTGEWGLIAVYCLSVDQP